MNGERLRLAPAALSTIEARNICIVKPSSLGDVVQALPLISALKARFPAARLSWVVNRSLAGLLEPITALDEVICFDRDALRSAGRATIVGFVGFLKQLRHRRFDLAIDLQGLLRSGMMVRATNAPRRIGLASAREFAGVFYTDVADDQPKATPRNDRVVRFHEMEASPAGEGAAPHQDKATTDRNAVLRYWKVAELLGVGGLAKQFSLELSDAERNWAKQRLATAKGTIIGVNPGARWETKRWPADRFAEAVNRVFADRPATAVVFGGPGEEAVAAETHAALSIPSINLCGQTTLRQLAAALERCDGLVTNDSGPMHLAAAVGTPTVSIFTCTSPARAAPFGEGHLQAATEVWCKASYLKQCNRMECLADLTVDRVAPQLAAMREMIAPGGGRRAA